MKQTNSLIALHNISKTFRSGKLSITVLQHINLEVEQGELIAIMGPSGSGKSTLMNIIGLLDRPSTGEIMIDDAVVSLSNSDAALARIRSSKIGFVFQSFNLLPKMSALANVLIPTTYYHVNLDPKKRAIELLKDLGLAARAHHKPSELSGGEKQRVAIARALMNDPELILADEPTGNLDSKSGSEVIKILHGLHQQGKTVIIVTHDEKIARQCQKTIHLLDGAIDSVTANTKDVKR